ncbi:MAG: hypothetical protein ACXACI_05070 [Candidatus Hodarchaeales archaeon]
MIDLSPRLDYRALYDQFSSEKAYKQQFDRYQSIDDLKKAIEEFRNQHECSSQLALTTLYLADFVVTSSNVRDLSISDEKRRTAILQFCQAGMEQELDAEALIVLHMLGQELGVAVRRNFVYQLDRGLPANIALVRIADIFVVPFLKFAKTINDELELAWLIALTEGAVSEVLPSEAYEQLKEKGHLKEFATFKLADVALSILEHFVATRTEEPNPHAKVPSLAESAGAILIRDTKSNKELFGYSEPMKDKKLMKLHKEFSEVCARSKFKEKVIAPVYYRATSLSSSAQQLTRQVFLVRSSIANNTYEAWFFLNTTVDDFNLELIRKKLDERCLDAEGILRRPSGIKKKIKKKKKKKEKPAIAKTPDKKKEDKPSLGKRIRSFFKRKKPPSEPEEPVIVKKEAIEPAKPEITEEIVKEQRIEVDEGEWNRKEVLNNWAAALVVDAVAGIDLEEVYDTLREQNWIITGLADFPEIPSPAGTLLTLDGYRAFLKGILYDLSSHFTELRDVAAQLLPQIAEEGQMRFIPQEVFLEHNIEDKLYDLLTFAATDENLTILIAQHSILTNVAYIKPNKAISKRRTLQMRTRQLATARTSFPIEDRMVSVLEPLIEISALKSQPVSTQLVYDLLPEK